MKKIIFFTVLGLLCLNFSIAEQIEKQRFNNKVEEIKVLNVGDTLPNLVFNKALNYKDTLLQFNDFEGKALILDFWATWCTGCIQGFPHLDSLQNKYADQLQILLLNISSRDSKAILNNFIGKQKLRLPDFNLPIVMADIGLKKRFPFQVLPHYMWVSKKREIMAITGAEALTTQNLERLLAGQKLNLPLKTN